VVLLAVLTPVLVVLRLARDPGADPVLAHTGPPRTLLEPAPVARRVPVVPAGAAAGRLTLPTPLFGALPDLDLGVRLGPLAAGATVTLTARDEAGRSLAACSRRRAESTAAAVITCAVERPEAVRSLEVAVEGARGPVRVDAREHANGLTTGGLYSAPPPRDLAGRVDRALDRMGVQRPAVAAPPVLLGAWAVSLGLTGAAVALLVLGPRRRSAQAPARQGPGRDEVPCTSD